MDILWNNLIANTERLFILSLFIGIFIALWKFKKSFVFAWLTVFIISFAFNISLQLEFFSAFYDPYVLNIKVNYLIPTIYWLDIMFLALFSYYVVLLLPKLWRKSIYIRWLIITVIFFWVLHVVSHPEIVVIINITRLIVYIGTGVLVSLGIKSRLKGLNLVDILKKYNVWFLSLLLFSGVLQLIIGGLQYIHGTDLGFSMLGESDLVAGMVGSSFIVSDHSVFLRAYGTFPHPNLYGAYFVVLLYLTLRILNVKELELRKKIELKQKYISVLSAILAVISVFGVILSFSRVAYLGVVLLVMGAVMEFILGRNFKNRVRNEKSMETKRLANGRSFKKGKKQVNSGFLLAGFDRTLNLGASLSERVYLLIVAGKIVLANIWIGVGAGMFVREIPQVIDRSIMLVGYSGILLLQPVHNVFLLFLSEYGLLGLFFIGITYWLIKNLFIDIDGDVQKKLVRSIIEKLGGFLGVAFVVWFLISLNFDHFWLSLSQGMGLVVVLVIMYMRS